MRLHAHNWPGNFRELESLIEVIISTTEDKIIQIHDVNKQIKNFDDRGKLLTDILGQVEGRDYSPPAPTDPDVQISRIRLLKSRSRCGVRLRVQLRKG